MDIERQRTRQSWSDMKSRCYNPKCHNYKNYGARGIDVCHRWLASFANFVADMGIKPSGLTLERIDNNQGYSPDNCKWATRAEQRRNQRSCHLILVNGKPTIFRDAAKLAGLPEQTLYQRIVRAGWPVERAMKEPLDQRQKAKSLKGLAARWSAMSASTTRKANCYNCGEDLGVIDVWPGDFPTCGSADCCKAEREEIRAQHEEAQQRALEDGYDRYR